ncbi:MAG: hypothetical protein ACK4GL_01465 [Flavobacteriales bacterium]
MLLNSCHTEDSGSVNETRISTFYELFYNENTNKTFALAKFTFGNALDTTLELNDPAQVTFNGYFILQNQISGFYEKEYNGRITQGTFVYTDLDDSVFTNTTPQMDSLQFPEMPQVIDISKAQDTYIQLVDNPVADNKVVSLIFALKLFTQATIGKDSIRIFANTIQDVNIGPHIGIMDRTKTTTPAQKPDAGGKMVVKYRPQNKSLNVSN